jgi:hypothetical protein
MTARLPDCQVLHNRAIGTLGAGELYLFMYVASQFPYISPTIAVSFIRRNSKLLQDYCCRINLRALDTCPSKTQSESSAILLQAPIKDGSNGRKPHGADCVRAAQRGKRHRKAFQGQATPSSTLEEACLQSLYKLQSKESQMRRCPFGKSALLKL